MKKQKNLLTLTLMFSSIVLLLVLQVLWLRSLYKDVKHDLRRETSMLFNSTVMAMQDSIIEKNIRPLPGDSTAEVFGKFKAIRDTVRFNARHREEFHRPDDDIRIFVSPNTTDSLQKFIRPLMSKIRGNRRQRTFMMRLTLDSLKPESIKKNFDRVLSKSGIPLTFSIERLGNHEHRREFIGFITDPFPFSPGGTYYAANFSDVRFFILKKISPQLFFSLFLTILTVGAFYLMYRSIVSNQRLVEIKNDFIGNVTHELKTPIATVSAAMEALKNFNALDNPQRAKEYIEMAQHELNRLSILTDKILKTAIFENHTLEFNTEDVDFAKTIRHVLDSMKLVFEKHRAKVDLQKEGSDFFLKGSNDHLINVIYNLLDNALKYSKTSPQILVSIKESGDKITLSVKDNGIGILPENLNKIFDKFYRVPTGDVADVKGYGLGLSYVQSVVELHQGSVEVQSKLDNGSTFIITLPKNLKGKA